MNAAGDRPAPAPLWLAALREGLRAFGIVAAVGVGASLAVWLLADPAYGVLVAVRIGALYMGAFHHVPIRIEGVFDIGRLTGGVLPNSDAPTEGSSFIEIGVALLAVTAFAGWLLVRAGERLAGTGSLRSCVARGASVAIPYALASLAVALLVTIDEPAALGRLVQGELRVSLAVAQAFVLPLAIAGGAGGVGGLRAWLATRPQDPRARSASAVLAGGWRMLWVSMALSYAGLFVAGVVQPDDVVAGLTPSTARYYEVVFERPAAGVAILAHHLALTPNEAAWVLVPAQGGCDTVRADEVVPFLCYGRFPDLEGVTTSPTSPGALVEAEPSGSFAAAPPGYLLFLLAPAVATVLGGREAARRVATRGRPGAVVGAMSGSVFAVLSAVVALLAGVSLSYGATVGERAGGGSLWMGPDVLAALLLGLVWGVVGGAIGGATAGVRSAAGRR